MSGGGKQRSELWLRVVSAVVLLLIFLPITWAGGVHFTIFFFVCLEGVPQRIPRFLPQGRNPLTLPCRDHRLR